MSTTITSETLEAKTPDTMSQDTQSTPQTPSNSAAQRPLVVVSNREPYSINVTENVLSFQKTTGGLVSALEPVLIERGGKWVCWQGQKALPHHMRHQYEDELQQLPFDMQTVELSSTEIDHYYNGFANDLLWPLFHYFQARGNFTEALDWENYVVANQRFADRVVEVSTPDEFVWVQDYQLLLVPELIREKSPNHPIGFFNHIPFPAYDVFRLLPNRREILRGMLGSDLVGFHTLDYADHFMDCVSRLLDLETTVYRDQHIIEYQGRRIEVRAFPISIDVAHIESIAGQAKIQADAVAVRQSFSAMGVDYIGIGVDRLDYTKGILERLEAIEAFFDTYPEFKQRFTFIQIAAPTRTKVGTYQTLREDVEQAVGRINGKFSEGTWSPIQYFYRSFSLDKLMPYFLAADLALVTPLRDGMNLVAKEYCAAQLDNNGVLLLSELAGAADELAGAITLNPYDQPRYVRKLHQALNMTKAEKAQRMAKLREQIATYDIHHWVNDYLEAFEQAVSHRGELQANP